MGKLYDSLQRQLNLEEYRKDAEDCLFIYDKLKEMNNGNIWETQWNALVTVNFMGSYPYVRIYKPNNLGYTIIEGIAKIKE